MNKLTLVSAVVQAVCGLVLSGLSIYYFTLEDYTKFGVFLVVGIVFIILPVRTFVRYRKWKELEKRTGQDEPPKKGFL